MWPSTRGRGTVVRTILRLHREDEEFRLMWDDFRLARKARRHFKINGDHERTEEYAQLCEELANDIRQYINGRE